MEGRFVGFRVMNWEGRVATKGEFEMEKIQIREGFANWGLVEDG
jgi:hypothetical protein